MQIDDKGKQFILKFSKKTNKFCVKKTKKGEVSKTPPTLYKLSLKITQAYTALPAP